MLWIWSLLRSIIAFFIAEVGKPKERWIEGGRERRGGVI